MLNRLRIEKDNVLKALNGLRKANVVDAASSKKSRIFEKYARNLTKLAKEDRLKYKPFPDIENDEEIASRMFTYLREIAVAYQGKTILIVSHGGVMRILLNHLGKNAPHGAASNTAYVKLESDGVEFFIKETKGIKFDD